MTGASGDRRRSSLKHGAGSALIMLLLLTLPCWAAAVPTVYIDPLSSHVEVGEEFDVSVMITADADTFSNYRIFFTYDTDIVEFLGASEGSLYTHLLPGFWTWFGVEEESLGTWEVFDNVFPSGSYVLAPGEMAVFRFRALADGYSPIHFLSGSVKDIDRYPLDPLEWEDGCVYVGPFSGVEGVNREHPRWSLGNPFPNP